MSNNHNLNQAKRAKNDEFYTQWADIEREVNAYLEYDKDVFKDKTILLPCDDPEWSNFTKYFAQNFVRFGLKKLISTSYAALSNPNITNYQPSDMETQSKNFDPSKTKSHGKIFTLTRDITMDGRIDFQDLEWDYLAGDGDFRSKELQTLIEESDIVVTNPPFSLFREFLKWIVENDKKFLIIGSMNAITYKEVFPLIRDNKLWVGSTSLNKDMVFEVPKGAKIAPKDKLKAEKMGYKGNFTRLGNSCWFTNIEHGRRRQPLRLMTEADNIKYSRHKEVRDIGYQKYDNYDVLEVPFTDAIPSDYRGVMGVPISFLDKYCPEQFEIVGVSEDKDTCMRLFGGYTGCILLEGRQPFKRIFIRHVNPACIGQP